MIVAAYNQENYIGRCLRSLLSQSLPTSLYEIVVVDDGSNDRTSYALGLFTDRFDSPIRVITNVQNLGLPASINIGIRAAQAPYIVRVDSDDFVNHNFLNFLSFYLDVNPEADAVACDYILLDDEERVIERCNCDEFPIACGIMFRTHQLYEVGLYDENFLCNEERELRIRFEKSFSIDRLKLPLYRYRRHETNLTNDMEKMLHHDQMLIDKHGIDPQVNTQFN